jgi:hypothetical protein
MTTCPANRAAFARRPTCAAGERRKIINAEIDANKNVAIQANGAGTILGVANSVLNASPTAVSLLNGGVAVSFGPSNVVSPAFTFSSTLPFKWTTLARGSRRGATAGSVWGIPMDLIACFGIAS